MSRPFARRLYSRTTSPLLQSQNPLHRNDLSSNESSNEHIGSTTTITKRSQMSRVQTERFVDSNESLKRQSRNGQFPFSSLIRSKIDSLITSFHLRFNIKSKTTIKW